MIHIKEKVVSVPDSLKKDVNQFIRNVLCSNLIYYFKQRIESFNENYSYGKDDNYYNIVERHMRFMEKIRDRFTITKEVEFHKDFPYFKEHYEIDMSNYTFKYGPVSEYLQSIIVFLTINDSDKYNGFYSRRKNMLYLMGNHYVEFLNEFGFNGEYFSDREFERSFNRVLDRFERMLSKYYLLFEHEMIHAIQHEFFGDYIEYTLSDLEINPLIVSEYNSLTFYRVER